MVNIVLVLVCDPVMGDNGQLYVPASFVTTYKDKLIQLADVITPNQTELEYVMFTLPFSYFILFSVSAWIILMFMSSSSGVLTCALFRCLSSSFLSPSLCPSIPSFNPIGY